MKKKNSTPKEEEEQIAYVNWLQHKELTFAAVPNSTFTKSWNQKRKNHLMGVRPGVPDMLVITPKGLIFIEMKRTKGGVVSLEQKFWLGQLNKLPGVQATVAYGCEEAIRFTERFL